MRNGSKRLRACLLSSRLYRCQERGLQWRLKAALAPRILTEPTRTAQPSCCSSLPIFIVPLPEYASAASRSSGRSRSDLEVNGNRARTFAQKCSSTDLAMSALNNASNVGSSTRTAWACRASAARRTRPSLRPSSSGRYPTSPTFAHSSQSS